MEIHKINDMVGGWFIGDFEPSVYRTQDFEVGIKKHHKGEQYETHYHKESTEINYLVEGKMIIQNKELTAGDVFVIFPYEISDPTFLEDCTVVVVKTPSSPKDKFIVK